MRCCLRLKFLQAFSLMHIDGGDTKCRPSIGGMVFSIKVNQELTPTSSFFSFRIPLELQIDLPHGHRFAVHLEKRANHPFPLFACQRHRVRNKPTGFSVLS